MKRLFKAILKVVIFLVLILVVNFILDFIVGLAPWIAPVLLVLMIIALIVFYYYKDKEEELMQIKGETMIFANEKGGYSTTVSNKNQDGTYDNMYIAVNFRKDVTLENQTRIDITNGFLSFYKTREGLPKPKIVVMDFEIKGKVEAKQEEVNEYEITNDDDLPF